jgi:hypothetical protein
LSIPERRCDSLRLALRFICDDEVSGPPRAVHGDISIPSPHIVCAVDNVRWGKHAASGIQRTILLCRYVRFKCRIILEELVLSDEVRRLEIFGGDLDSFGCVCPTLMSSSRGRTRICHFPYSEQPLHLLSSRYLRILSGCQYHGTIHLLCQYHMMQQIRRISPSPDSSYRIK